MSSVAERNNPRKHHPRADFFLFAEAWVLLHFWKITSLIFPLRYYASMLGTLQQSTPEEPCNDPHILPVIRAIARGKKYSPTIIKCLPEAITAHRMLHRRNLRSTLYFGIARKDEHSIIAHAWLRCGDKIITGKRGMKKFTAVSSFAFSS